MPNYFECLKCNEKYLDEHNNTKECEIKIYKIIECEKCKSENRYNINGYCHWEETKRGNYLSICNYYIPGDELLELDQFIHCHKCGKSLYIHRIEDKS